MSRLRGTAALALVVLMALAPTARAGERRTTGDGRFVPPTNHAGKIEVLPITLPDGTRAELRFPRRLHLADLGFLTPAAVEWDVRPDPLRCCGRVLSIERTTINFTYSGRKPIRTFRGANGTKVPYFDSGGPLDYLVFQFGPWMVSVYNHEPGDFEDQMSDKELATWARSLEGHTDKRGFLVLTAKKPLIVEPLIDFVFGTRVAGQNFLEIASPYCTGSAADTDVRRRFPNGVAWCDPRSGWHVSAEGDPDFVQGISDDLQIKVLKPRR